MFVSIVHDVFLLHSSLPNEGLLQITTGKGTKSVYRKSLDDKDLRVICIQLGYAGSGDISSTAPSSVKNDKIFSGSINCKGGERGLSQCSITSSTESCSELSYIKCKCLNKKPREYDYLYLIEYSNIFDWLKRVLNETITELNVFTQSLWSKMTKEVGSHVGGPDKTI